MSIIAQLKALTPAQRSAIWASYLGWTLDAFDFFLLVFMKTAIAKEFGATDAQVSEALFLTLAARPFGAFAFGWLADRFGRRPILMIVILAFSGFSVASGLAWSLGALLAIRAAFGFAMGGEWGIGASLVMESIPPKLRGFVSGLLQSGYPSGYFLASLAYYLLFDHIGWRGMFFVGVAPALLVFLIRLHVEESPAHLALADRPRVNPLAEIARHWKIALYLVVLMTAFNFFSHGTQDQYPTFLQKQHGFDTHTTGILTAIMNLGAIVGGISFGIWSERIGRRRAIIIASLLALPVIPLWAFASTPLLLGLGAFLIQVAVQGAWGIVPVHLNELSPALARGLFPGFAYQLGNLIASRNAPFQAWFAAEHGGNYGLALALVAGVTAVVLVIWTAIGPERRDVDFRGGGKSGTMKATIWHNPRCSKSRETLAILQAAPGVEIEVIEYLKHPPSRDTLARLYAKAGMTAREGLRIAERGAKPLAHADDDAILDAMAAEPILVERPLVETAKGVRLGRPPEKVRDIL